MARTVVLPLEGNVMLARFPVPATGFKSCVKRNATPGSFAANNASTGTVLPATGNLPSAIRTVAIFGPRESIVLNLTTNGSFVARLPARSKTLLTVMVMVAFGGSSTVGVKFNTSPFNPPLAAPVIGPVVPVSVKTNPVECTGSLNEMRGTLRGSICTALLLGKIETSTGGSLSFVV